MGRRCALFKRFGPLAQNLDAGGNSLVPGRSDQRVPSGTNGPVGIGRQGALGAPDPSGGAVQVRFTAKGPGFTPGPFLVCGLFVGPIEDGVALCAVQAFWALGPKP